MPRTAIDFVSRSTRSIPALSSMRLARQSFIRVERLANLPTEFPAHQPGFCFSHNRTRGHLMNRRLLVALLLVFPAAALAQNTQRYIVVTQHAYDEAVHALPREDFEFGARAAMRVRRFESIDGFAADLSADQVRRLSTSPEVQWIEPVVERHALDDTVVAGQQTTPYGITMVKAPQVWPVTRGRAVNGSGPIHLAVIDTGIDYKSPELQAIYRGGHNFVTASDDPLDDNVHGSHVSGIIAAADDGEGVVGVAPAIDLYALKVLNTCGSGSSEDVISAVDWVVRKKAAIGG